MKHFDTVDDIPDFPVAKTPEEQSELVKQFIACGAIPKKDLEIGATYEGSCRNSSTAIWNGSEFEYLRYKWGTKYTDTIKHFEDDMYYDVFIPIKKI